MRLNAENRKKVKEIDMTMRGIETKKEIQFKCEILIAHFFIHELYQVYINFNSYCRYFVVQC